MRFLTMLGLAILLVSPQSTQAQVVLKFKFPDSVMSTIVSESIANQTLTLAGMEIVTASNQKKTIAMVNGKRDAQGRIQVEQAFRDLEASVSLPGGIELQFDSEVADNARTGSPADVLIDIMAATAKSKWTMVHDSDDRVISVAGGKETLEKLDEQTRQLVEKQFDADYLKEQANTELDLFPATPVTAGETWRRSSEVRLEAGQILMFTTDYQYKGIEKNAAGKELDRIAITVKEVSYLMDEDSPSPLRLRESELKIADAEGYILFDRQSGQIVEQKDKVHITGTITFSAGGNDIPGKLDLNLENHTKRT